MYIFEISTKRRIFWCPIRPIQTKKFSSLRRDNELFWELKRSKWKKPLKFSKNGFLYKDLRFFYVKIIHWSLLHTRSQCSRFGNSQNWDYFVRLVSINFQASDQDEDPLPVLFDSFVDPYSVGSETFSRIRIRIRKNQPGSWSGPLRIRNEFEVKLL